MRERGPAVAVLAFAALAAGGCVSRRPVRIAPLTCPPGLLTPAILGQVFATDTPAPVDDARVLVEGDSASATPLATANTDLSGAFVLSPVPSGHRVIVARMIGYMAQRQAIVVPVAGCLKLRFLLVPRKDDVSHVIVN